MITRIVTPLRQMDSHQRIIFLIILISLIIQSTYLYHIASQELFLPDDAYYYFLLGRNISEGMGPKIDSFNDTTGFQPLWGAVCTLAFTLIPNETLAVLSLLIVSLMAELLTVWILYKWMSDLEFPKAAITLMTCSWIFSSLTMLNSLNGMETGLGVLLVMAVYYSLRSNNAWVTGLLCGVAILTRIDTLILAMSIAAVWLYQKQFRQIIIFCSCIFFSMVPWILFVLSIGKSPLPESGRAVWLITLIGNGVPYSSLGESIWKNPFFHLEQFVSFLNFIGWNTIALYPFSLFPNLSAILVCLFIIVIAIHWGQKTDVRIFLLHIAGLIVGYSLFVGGDWFHFRYTTSPGLLFSAIIMGLLYQRINNKRLVRTYVVFVSAGLMILNILFNPIINRFHNLGLSLVARVDGFHESATWMNENLPSTSIVGAFQSGAIGYYGSFPIVNLDGKVNNPAYLALKNKDMWNYLCRNDIDYVADWQTIIDDFLINRSLQWKDDNLMLIKQISDVSIYAVNHANCKHLE